ncbi:hypothetical protein BH18THE2_BH18THE2_15150 [soil metagenome]
MQPYPYSIQQEMVFRLKVNAPKVGAVEDLARTMPTVSPNRFHTSQMLDAEHHDDDNNDYYM